ncbi:GntR family transcriptional regulator, partial [Klebsiella pneumoniae]
MDISSGKLAEGEKIPTEIELSELYNISRITVRNAVKELVAEGY